MSRTAGLSVRYVLVSELVHHPIISLGYLKSVSLEITSILFLLLPSFTWPDRDSLWCTTSGYYYQDQVEKCNGRKVTIRL